MSAALRARGGAWRTVARSPEHAAEAAERLHDASVCCLGADGRIPFPAHAFDAVVVSLGLPEALPDAQAFLRECNRVLRPSGLLVLSAQARRPFSVCDAVRRRFAPSGPYAALHTEEELCALLKTGFNVTAIDARSRFFVEWVRLRDAALALRGVPDGDRAARLRGAYALARAADAPLFWIRRHVLAFAATRRPWSDRSAPLLSNGRAIGEAVLFNPNE